MTPTATGIYWYLTGTPTADGMNVFVDCVNDIELVAWHGAVVEINHMT